MKSLICIKDRVFFNKHIYNKGDCVNMDEELLKEAPTGCFEEKKEKVEVIKKVTSTKKETKPTE